MPIVSPFRKTATATASTPEAAGASSFRNLYTRVLLGLQTQQAQQVQQAPKTSKSQKTQHHPILGVTSAIAGEGTTTIASGLAAALAEDGALVGVGREPGTILLVECNEGAPPKDPRFALHPGPGLVEVLRGECALEAAVQPTGVERLSILPIGEPSHNFPLAIRTAALPDVIAQLRSRFGLVILDLPPVLNSTDTQVVAPLADQLVLVVRAAVTPAKLVRQALDRLTEEKLLGVVLNDSRPDLPSWLDNRL
jgi:Mrp family chromosome partitioning ATPase